MRFGWDVSKAAANLAKHGVAFEAVDGFDFETALVRADTRMGYGEVRLVALGAIGDRLHALVFTIRPGVVWIISLRKANAKEGKHYVDEAGGD